MDTPYKVGMVLSAGTPLATVASENSDLEVVAYVTLNDRPLLHVGDPARSPSPACRSIPTAP